MKLVSIALICLGALACELAAAIAHEDSQVWLQYKQKHGKFYADQVEEAKRFDIFMANKQRVEEHNSKAGNFTMALNHMSDWTPEEYAQINGFKMSAQQAELEMISSEELEQLIGSDAPVPEEFDWRQHEGRVSEVKDQMHCGSCWAFATVGLLEGQELGQKMGALVPLSVQEIVDCTDTNIGCYGGMMSDALRDLATDVGGIEAAADYPYTATYDHCHKNAHKFLPLKIGGYKMLPAGDEKTLKRVLATYGPVAIAFQASEQFHLYEKGILVDDECKSGHANHGVLIVGYGRDREKGLDFWIVKNSWGKSWGESGYFRIKAGENMCGVADLATLATFK